MNIYQQLARQGRGRDLSPEEIGLAEAMEAIFATSLHKPDEVAAELNKRGVKRPSGGAEEWSAAVLLEELRAINASLDEAYESSINFVSAGTR